jgi:hypothetical protein
VATAYQRHVVVGLFATFTEESKGRTARSVLVSPVTGTSQFRIQVYSKWHLARFWELGWRHWKQATGKGRVLIQSGKGKGKTRTGRTYKIDAVIHRRKVWRPVLYDNIAHYRRLFFDHMEAKIGGPMPFRGR